MKNTRWGHGESMDGKGEFKVQPAAPVGGLPKLAPPHPKGHAQVEEMMGAAGNGMMNTLKHKL